MTTLTMSPEEIGGTEGFEGTAAALEALAEQGSPIDAVVVALAAEASHAGQPGWQQMLADHDDLVTKLHTDIAWVRGVADHATSSERPLRLLTLTDAATTAGRTRAARLRPTGQSCPEGNQGPGRRVRRRPRIASDHRPGRDQRDRRSPPVHPRHRGALWCRTRMRRRLVRAAIPPRPTASVTVGGTAVPPWLDDTLRGIVRGEAGQRR